MQRLTLSQIRAAHALKCVEKVADATRNRPMVRKRYVSYVKRLGPMILMCGLGQAVASELASSNKKKHSEEAQAHKLLYENIKSWLCHSEGAVYEGYADLVESIINFDQELYLRAQAEALWWLEWHKKFCIAYFGDEESQGG